MDLAAELKELLDGGSAGEVVGVPSLVLERAVGACEELHQVHGPCA